MMDPFHEELPDAVTVVAVLNPSRQACGRPSRPPAPRSAKPRLERLLGAAFEHVQQPITVTYLSHAAGVAPDVFVDPDRGDVIEPPVGRGLLFRTDVPVQLLSGPVTQLYRSGPATQRHALTQDIGEGDVT